MHHGEQMEKVSERNERAYILAACGIPQLTDEPRILFQQFPQDSLYAANAPDEYVRLYQHMLGNPEETADRAALAFRTVFQRHTVFHRAERFVRELDM